MKNRAVIFGPMMAKVEKCDSTAHYGSAINVLVNPDLSRVRGISPIYWKKVGNKVEPMNPFEKMRRDLLIAAHEGSSHDPVLVFKKKSIWGLIGYWVYVLFFVSGSVVLGLYVWSNFLGGRS